MVTESHHHSIRLVNLFLMLVEFQHNFARAALFNCYVVFDLHTTTLHLGFRVKRIVLVVCFSVHASFYLGGGGGIGGVGDGGW